MQYNNHILSFEKVRYLFARLIHAVCMDVIMYLSSAFIHTWIIQSKYCFLKEKNLMRIWGNRSYDASIQFKNIK